MLLEPEGVRRSRNDKISGWSRSKDNYETSLFWVSSTRQKNELRRVWKVYIYDEMQVAGILVCGKRMTIKVWQSRQKMWQFMECVTLLDENAWQAWFVPAHSGIYHRTHLPRDPEPPPGGTFFLWHILHVAILVWHHRHGTHHVHSSSDCVAIYRSRLRSSLTKKQEWNGWILWYWLLTKQLYGRNLDLCKAIIWRDDVIWFAICNSVITEG